MLTLRKENKLAELLRLIHQVVDIVYNKKKSIKHNLYSKKKNKLREYNFTSL